MKPIDTPVLDLVSIDYIRLATWDWQLYLDLAARMRRKWVSWRKTRWLQYAMETHDDKVSYGCATQQDKGHGVIQASGVDAHVLFHWLIKTVGETDRLKLYATRIDLQCTKTRHPNTNYVKMHKRLRKPKQLILGDDGSTLYIGNRESDSYWRLYDKTAQHTRLEVELKGKQAKAAWLFLQNQPSEIAALYSAHIQKSRIPSLMAHYYQQDILPAKSDDLKPSEDNDLEKKVRWLGTLDRLVYKLVNDHDVGERAREIIQRWHEYGTKD